VFCLVDLEFNFLLKIQAAKMATMAIQREAFLAKSACVRADCTEINSPKLAISNNVATLLSVSAKKATVETIATNATQTIMVTQKKEVARASYVNAMVTLYPTIVTVVMS